MPKLSLILFLLLLAATQLVLATVFGGSMAVVPNLLIIAIVWFIFHRPFADTAIVAVIGGIFLDFFGGLPFGTHLASFLFLAWILHLLTTYVSPKEASFYLVAGTVIFSLAISQLFIFLLASTVYFFQKEPALEFARFFSERFMWQMLYTLIVTYPCFFLGRKVIIDHPRVS